MRANEQLQWGWWQRWVGWKDTQIMSGWDRLSGKTGKNIQRNKCCLLNIISLLLHVSLLQVLGRKLVFNNTTDGRDSVYLLLSCSGVCYDFTVFIDGTGDSAEQAVHGQARIHKSHTGCVQKGWQELQNTSRENNSKKKWFQSRD